MSNEDEKFVALYLRVSTEEQALQGFSIDNQRERLIAFCASQGWDNYRLYIDDGQTGTKLSRPAMERLIVHAKNGMIKTVVVYKLDRLSRKQKDVLYLLEDVFDKNDVAFKSATEPFDTSTPLGKATIGILAVFAQLERDMIIERTRSGRRQRISQGMWSGGRIPYGYLWDRPNRKLIINPEQADIVRQIYRMYLQGQSLAALSDWFTSRVSVIKLDHSGIKKFLSRAIYTGRLSTGTGGLVDGTHEAIIDLQLYDMVQTELERRSDGASPVGKHLLTGLCRCGLCGGPIVCVGSRRHGKSYRYYACKDQHVRTRDRSGKGYCKLGYTRQDKLEPWIVSKIMKLALDKTALKEELIRSSAAYVESIQTAEEVRSQLKIVKERLNKWYDAFEQGVFNATQLKSRIESLEEEKERLTLRMEEAKGSSREPKTDVLRETLKIIGDSWSFMDLEEQHTVLRAAIKRIVLMPKSDPIIEWNI